jgi:hypothetical protein
MRPTKQCKSRNYGSREIGPNLSVERISFEVTRLIIASSLIRNALVYSMSLPSNEVKA